MGGIGDPGLCEEVTMAVRITVLDNGPYMVEGEFTLQDPQGKAFTVQGQAFLCRCGASQNKPFCDGSHKNVEFRSEVRA